MPDEAKSTVTRVQPGHPDYPEQLAREQAEAAEAQAKRPTKKTPDSKE